MQKLFSPLALPVIPSMHREAEKFWPESTYVECMEALSALSRESGGAAGGDCIGLQRLYGLQPVAAAGSDPCTTPAATSGAASRAGFARQLGTVLYVGSRGLVRV
eukprot:4072791-Prymnesium_polylepis.1